MLHLFLETYLKKFVPNKLKKQKSAVLYSCSDSQCAKSIVNIEIRDSCWGIIIFFIFFFKHVY